MQEDICQGCHHPFEADAQFCRMCGKPRVRTQVFTQSQPQAAPWSSLQIAQGSASAAPAGATAPIGSHSHISLHAPYPVASAPKATVFLQCNTKPEAPRRREYIKAGADVIYETSMARNRLMELQLSLEKSMGDSPRPTPRPVQPKLPRVLPTLNEWCDTDTSGMDEVLFEDLQSYADVLGATICRGAKVVEKEIIRFVMEAVDALNDTSIAAVKSNFEPFNFKQKQGKEDTSQRITSPRITSFVDVYVRITAEIMVRRKDTLWEVAYYSSLVTQPIQFVDVMVPAPPPLEFDLTNAVPIFMKPRGIAEYNKETIEDRKSVV